MKLRAYDWRHRVAVLIRCGVVAAIAIGLASSAQNTRADTGCPDVNPPNGTNSATSTIVSQNQDSATLEPTVTTTGTSAPPCPQILIAGISVVNPNNIDTVLIEKYQTDAEAEYLRTRTATSPIIKGTLWKDAVTGLGTTIVIRSWDAGQINPGDPTGKYIKEHPEINDLLTAYYDPIFLAQKGMSYGDALKKYQETGDSTWMTLGIPESAVHSGTSRLGLTDNFTYTPLSKTDMWNAAYKLIPGKSSIEVIIADDSPSAPFTLQTREGRNLAYVRTDPKTGIQTLVLEFRNTQKSLKTPKALIAPELVKRDGPGTGLGAIMAYGNEGLYPAESSEIGALKKLYSGDDNKFIQYATGTLKTKNQIYPIDPIARMLR